MPQNKGSTHVQRSIIKAGSFVIGDNRPCFIIAEAGLNHNGSLELAKKMADLAKEAGANAVKYQTFKSKDLVSRNTAMASYQEKNIGRKERQSDMLQRLELSYNDFRKLKKYCDENGILFLSTPHTDNAVDFLDKLVPLFKIGSGDLNNLSLIEKVAKKNKPIILSTGMSTLDEIATAIMTIRKYHNLLVVLHCTTNYPCPRKDVNLKAMLMIKKKFNCLTGYSDHTEGIDVPVMAASLGAVVIEKHFTLNKNMEGPDHAASLDPAELKEMVRRIRLKSPKVSIPKEILGVAEKKPTKEELTIARIARKSIIANKDITKGSRITQSALIIKRPGTGIQPKYINEIIGKIALRRIVKDCLIRWSDIKK